MSAAACPSRDSVAGRPPATYLEALPRFRRIPIRVWAATSACSTITAVAGFLFWNEPALLGTFAVLGICIGVVPLVMRLIYAMLFSWVQHAPTFLRKQRVVPPDWSRWFESEFRNFASSRRTAYIALVFGVSAQIVFWWAGAFQRLPVLLTIACMVISFISNFVCGVGLMALLYLARFIWRVGSRYSVRISDHEYGVLSTGRFLASCFALVAMVWCLYLGSSTWSVRDRWIPVLWLAMPTMVMFVISFVACQFPLHKRMVECKRATLTELDDVLERLRYPLDASEERRKQFEFCIAELKRVENWPEWPFGIGNFSGVTGATMAAIAPQVLRALLPMVVHVQPEK